MARHPGTQAQIILMADHENFRDLAIMGSAIGVTFKSRSKSKDKLRLIATCFIRMQCRKTEHLQRQVTIEKIASAARAWALKTGRCVFLTMRIVRSVLEAEGVRSWSDGWKENWALRLPGRE